MPYDEKLTAYVAKQWPFATPRPDQQAPGSTILRVPRLDSLHRFFVGYDLTCGNLLQTLVDFVEKVETLEHILERRVVREFLNSLEHFVLDSCLCHDGALLYIC